MIEQCLVKFLTGIRHVVAWTPKILLYGVPLSMYVAFCYYKFDFQAIPWAQINSVSFNQTADFYLDLVKQGPNGFFELFIAFFIAIFLAALTQLCIEGFTFAFNWYRYPKHLIKKRVSCLVIIGSVLMYLLTWIDQYLGFSNWTRSWTQEKFSLETYCAKTYTRRVITATCFDHASIANIILGYLE